MKFRNLGDEKFGIRVYETSLNKSLAFELNERLTHPESCNRWSRALVAYGDIPDDSHRNCDDFKLAEEQLGFVQERVAEIWQKTASQIRNCVRHYSNDYGIDMGYMEAINFVKYEPGEHFSYHSDHGFHYKCTVSTVAFLNDNFVGGRLDFDKFGVSIQPTEGEVVVFPSTFIYTHASLPVSSGIKYVAVTMFDYDNEYSRFRKSQSFRPENDLEKASRSNHRKQPND